MTAALRAAGLLALAAAIAYCSSFSGVFQFDDHKVIVGDPAVHSWGAFIDDLGRGIRPLLKLSYTANWTSGLGLAGFHATNLLIHWASALLVLLLSQRLAARWLPERPATQAALLAALLFALHPVHTEAVTYVSGRSSSLMALCCLAGLAAYAAGGRLRYGLSPLLFAMAVAVKETAMIFPLALLLWDRASGGRPGDAWRRQWVHWALWLAAAFVVLLHGRYAAMLIEATGALAAGQNLATQIHGFLYLLSRLVRVDALNIDPDLPLLPACDARCGLEVAAIAALVGTARAAARRRPWWSFAIAWLLVHVLLLNLVAPRMDVANERQLYVASWPLLLALSVEAVRLAAARPVWVPWLRGGAAVLLAALAAATMARNADYASEIALWEDTARHSPGKARVWNNLGYAYQLAGRKAEAGEAYRRALLVDPGHPEARVNLQAIARPGG